MKVAEIARKEAANVEKDMCEDLCFAMEQKDFTRFQMEIDGVEYEFEREEFGKVKSKKLREED